MIREDGDPAFYVVPAGVWGKVRGVIEDTDGNAAFDRAVVSDDGTRIP